MKYNKVWFIVAFVLVLCNRNLDRKSTFYKIDNPIFSCSLFLIFVDYNLLEYNN